MRAFILGLVALGLPSCASVPDQLATSPVPYRMTMPLQVLKDEGEAPRMGDVWLRASEDGPGSDFQFSIYFDSDGTRLGGVSLGAWNMAPVSYCRNRPSWVQSVLTAPSGQEWVGRLIFVPQGPDHDRIWSAGSTTARYDPLPRQGLKEALEAGGVFRLALRDDEGQEWTPVLIDTLSPAERNVLFEANLAELRALDPASVPVQGEPMVTVSAASPANIPNPSRPCPPARQTAG